MKWKKEFEEKFATDIFAYSYTNYDMIYTKLKQFISTQIEKAKQEERGRIKKIIKEHKTKNGQWIIEDLTNLI